MKRGEIRELNRADEHANDLAHGDRAQGGE